ncbi:MAG: glycoside hydrolase family 105 protein, partial [Anaerolineae bacterium]
ALRLRSGRAWLTAVLLILGAGLLLSLAFRGPWNDAGGGATLAETEDIPIFLPLIVKGPPGCTVDPYLPLVVQRTMELDLDGWDWDSGVALYGLMRAWQCTGERSYFDFVRAWVDERLREGIPLSHVNHATPGLAALMLYEETGEEAYLGAAQQIADFLLYGAPRSQDGGFLHWEDQLWVDTLFVTTPFLARLGRVTGEAALYDEAADQILIHAHHLQDPATGLFHHGWDQSQDSNMSAAFWGRGNGWGAMACAEVLDLLPPDHPQRAAIADILARQIQGMVALQDESGRWHTVVDHPEFYLETSATEAMAYAMKMALRQGVIGSEYNWPATRALLAVQAQIASDGTVQGVSAGTGVQPTIEDYNRIPHQDIQLWGQGFYLMLASEE